MTLWGERLLGPGINFEEFLGDGVTCTISNPGIMLLHVGMSERHHVALVFSLCYSIKTPVERKVILENHWKLIVQPFLEAYMYWNHLKTRNLGAVRLKAERRRFFSMSTLANRLNAKFRCSVNPASVNLA